MDADMYFRRGEMYEIENKMLAIDDFSKVSYITYNAAIYIFVYFRAWYTNTNYLIIYLFICFRAWYPNL